jgi:hypothetical protein
VSYLFGSLRDKLQSGLRPTFRFRESRTDVNPDIQWIEAVFGSPKPDDTNLTHVAVPGNARPPLLDMVGELVGTNGLVALYVPEGTEDVYKPGPMRGRVICAVQLVAMPPGKRLEDYFYDDWDGSRRWPIGWPARLIYSPPIAECPTLRDHVQTLYGSGSFGGYVARFQHGSFPLEQAMRERLNRDFAQFTRLA